MGPESEFVRADWAINGSELEHFDARRSGSLYLDFDVSFQLGLLLPLVVLYHSPTLSQPLHIDNIHTTPPPQVTISDDNRFWSISGPPRIMRHETRTRFS